MRKEYKTPFRNYWVWVYDDSRPKEHQTLENIKKGCRYWYCWTDEYSSIFPKSILNQFRKDVDCYFKYKEDLKQSIKISYKNYITGTNKYYAWIYRHSEYIDISDAYRIQKSAEHEVDEELKQSKIKSELTKHFNEPKETKMKLEIYGDYTQQEVLMLRLFKDDTGIVISAVDENGDRLFQSSILKITNDGYLKRFTNIGISIPLKLDSDRRIIEGESI